jgi:hypothetical protein
MSKATQESTEDAPDAPWRDLLKVNINGELVQIIKQDAIDRKVYMGDIVGEVLADYYQRPDLRGIPRKIVGRKPSIKSAPGKKKKGKK